MMVMRLWPARGRPVVDRVFDVAAYAVSPDQRALAGGRVERPGINGNGLVVGTLPLIECGIFLARDQQPSCVLVSGAAAVNAVIIRRVVIQEGDYCGIGDEANLLGNRDE